jgi:hypothetical protein
VENYDGEGCTSKLRNQETNYSDYDYDYDYE